LSCWADFDKRICTCNGKSSTLSAVVFCVVLVKRKLFDDEKTNLGNLPTDLSPVVDAYEHALLASYPRPRYIMGRGATAFMIPILAAMPELITDRVLNSVLKAY